MRTENRIRQIPLLAEEVVVELFVPDDGIVDHPPDEGSLLSLTNRRLIAFVDVEGKKETRITSLEKVDGVSVKAHSRNPKPLYQGLSLGLVGVLVYLVLGTFGDGVTVAAFLGGAIGFLGLLFIARYLTWEQGGEVTFQVGAWELTFPYSSNRVVPEAYQVIHRYFQLKAGESIERYAVHQAAVSDSAGAVKETPSYWADGLGEKEGDAGASTWDVEESPPSGEKTSPVTGEGYRDAEGGPFFSSDGIEAEEGVPEVSSQGPERDPRPGPDPPPDHGSDESSRRLLP